MGSLMSGWDAPVHDPEKVKLMRNKSLTKEEIEAYWRSKKKTKEEHTKAISSISPKASQIYPNSPQKGFITKSTTNFTNRDFDTCTDELSEKNSCWWTRSNLAFLNEPHVMI